jgi:hypothetical protein
MLGADGRGDRISGGRDFDRASVDRGRDRVTGVERANRE